MTILDICIPIRGDADRVTITLEYLVHEDILDKVRLCVSENRLDSGFRSAAQKLGIPLETITFSRSAEELSFPENLARSGCLGSSPFLTFCGAGDLVKSSVLDLVHLMGKDPSTLVATGGFDLYDPRQGELSNIGRRRQLQASRGLNRIENIEDRALWLFDSSLSSIGGWVMRREYFEQCLLQTSPMWEEARFPMRIWALPSLREGRILNYAENIFSSRLEFDSDRQTNALYQDTRWCREVSQAASHVAPCIAEDIYSIETSQIEGNILSFLSFGSKPTAQRAVTLLTRRSHRLFWSLIIQTLGWCPIRQATRHLTLRYRSLQLVRRRRRRRCD
jgi:hypothetical protein